MSLNVKVAQQVHPSSLMLMVAQNPTATQHIGQRTDQVSGLYFTAMVDAEQAGGKRAALYRMSEGGNSLVDAPEEIYAYLENLNVEGFPFVSQDYLGVPAEQVKPRGGARNGHVEDA